MTILGIDTTGFSTSVAIVKDGKEVLFNYVNPGYNIDKKWNEVSRELPQMHFEFLMNNFDKFVKQSGLDWSEIDAIAVSAKSGIESCITMGKSFAKNYSKNHSKPIIEVDHILAHIYSTWIGKKEEEKFDFPILAFSSSGSHNSLALIKSEKYCSILPIKDIYDVEGDTKFHLGIGKYFFRVFNFLELDKEKDGWQKFIKMMKEGDPKKYDSLNLSVKRHYEFDDRIFDFSDLMWGIKNYVEEQKKENGELSEEQKKDLAASFQEIVSTEIANYLLFLTRLLQAKEVHLSGGISVNWHIENKVRETLKEEFPKVKIRLPQAEYRLDNAAMIASLAYYQEKYGIEYKNFEAIVTK